MDEERKRPRRQAIRTRSRKKPAYPDQEMAAASLVQTVLEKLRRLFVECNGQWSPLSVILARYDPTQSPPIEFDTPKLLSMPMPEGGDLGHFLGVISSAAGSFGAYSMFFVIDGILVQEGSGYRGRWCQCGRCADGKRVLLCYFEHKILPRKAWYAEVEGNPPESAAIGNWQPLPFPADLTFAFGRTN